VPLKQRPEELERVRQRPGDCSTCKKASPKGINGLHERRVQLRPDFWSSQSLNGNGRGLIFKLPRGRTRPGRADHRLGASSSTKRRPVLHARRRTLSGPFIRSPMTGTCIGRDSRTPHAIGRRRIRRRSLLRVDRANSPMTSGIFASSRAARRHRKIPACPPSVKIWPGHRMAEGGHHRLLQHGGFAMFPHAADVHQLQYMLAAPSHGTGVGDLSFQPRNLPPGSRRPVVRT